jgi:hypothetical protein
MHRDGHADVIAMGMLMCLENKTGTSERACRLPSATVFAPVLAKSCPIDTLACLNPGPGIRRECQDAATVTVPAALDSSPLKFVVRMAVFIDDGVRTGITLALHSASRRTRKAHRLTPSKTTVESGRCWDVQ